MRIVQSLSFILSLLLVPYAIYNSYTSFSFGYRRAFLEMGQWSRNGWAEPFAVISTGMKFSYFALATVPPLFGVITMIGAIVTFSNIARGHIFSPIIPRAVRWLGVGIFGAAVTQFLAVLLFPMVMSWNNSAGPEPLRWQYDSENIALMFCGVAFWIIGHIMLQVVTVQQGRNTFG